MEAIIPNPEELEHLRQTTRRFMREEVRPAEDKVEHDAYQLPAELLNPLQQKAKEIGLWALRSPVEYGGQGMGLEASAVFAEEASRCKMGAYMPACGATGSNPPAPILLGTKEQIEKFAIPAIAHGAKVYMAISEPSGGSDPARSIRTRAVLKGDHYVLNGSKLWISGAKSAKWGLVFARTGDQGDRGGITEVDENRRRNRGFVRSGDPLQVPEHPDQHRQAGDRQNCPCPPKRMVIPHPLNVGAQFAVSKTVTRDRCNCCAAVTGSSIRYPAGITPSA